jgi:hypothetical protein
MLLLDAARPPDDLAEHPLRHVYIQRTAREADQLIDDDLFPGGIVDRKPGSAFQIAYLDDQPNAIRQKCEDPAIDFVDFAAELPKAGIGIGHRGELSREGTDMGVPRCGGHVTHSSLLYPQVEVPGA